MSEVDRMAVIAHWTLIGVRNPSDGGTHAAVLNGPTLGFGERIEVVPSTTHRGAVEANKQAAALLDSLGHHGNHRECAACDFVRAHHPAIGGQS